MIRKISSFAALEHLETDRRYEVRMGRKGGIRIRKKLKEEMVKQILKVRTLVWQTILYDVWRI